MSERILVKEAKETSPCDVSVVLLTYRPNWEKLQSTLKSVIQQRDVSFELIVSDDGSDEDMFQRIKEYLDCNQIQNYKLIKNIENVGVVNNLYNALLFAKGAYTYYISPGDMFYDDTALKKIYDFSVLNNIDVCFGDAVYYNTHGGSVNIVKRRYGVPRRPWIYNKDIPMEEMKYFFFKDNFILGATVFRKTSVAIEYIGRIKNICKYIEDNTSFAFYLADGNRIYHYDGWIIWYEFGDGISTQNDKKWGERIDSDLANCFKAVYEQYPKDQLIRILLESRKYTRFTQKLYLLYKLPRLFFRKLIIKFTPMSKHKRNYDVNILKEYLKG